MIVARRSTGERRVLSTRRALQQPDSGEDHVQSDVPRRRRRLDVPVGHVQRRDERLPANAALYARPVTAASRNDFLQRRNPARVAIKPNSITLASSELAPDMLGASSELFRNWFETEIWPII